MGDVESTGSASSRSWAAVRALWGRAASTRTSGAMIARMRDRAYLERLWRDRDEETALVRAYQGGDLGAGLVLWKANVPLVQKCFPRRLLWFAGDELQDYWQEARLGFLEGVARFDVTRGLRLHTFAMQYALSYTRRAFMTRGEVVHVPVQVRDRWRDHWRRTVILFTDKTIRPGHSGEADAIAFEESLVDEHALAEEVFEGEELRARAHTEVLVWLLEGVQERWMEILLARYAEDGEEKTLLELGVEQGMSRERIRQLQEEALGLLRKRARGIGADPENFRAFDEWIAWAYLRLKETREVQDRKVSRAAEKALRVREAFRAGRSFAVGRCTRPSTGFWAERGRGMDKQQTFHEVKPEDMERIACGKCGAARAVFCEHAPNARGISFWYYCAACWIEPGSDGVSPAERTHPTEPSPRLQSAVTWRATMYAAEVGPWHLSAARTSDGYWIWHVVDSRRSDRDGWVHVAQGKADTESASMQAAHAAVLRAQAKEKEG